MTHESKVARLRALLERSRHVVVFTGAGISTESGIPDFRGPSGIWKSMTPIYFQDFVASAEVRRESWRRWFEGTRKWTAAQPNRGHYAVARLVAQGRAPAVITQNVDNLHQVSGVPPEQVIELHGNASYAHCLDCGRRVELDAIEVEYRATGTVGPCGDCGGIVKTATISFGQSLPEQAVRRAEQETLACDLFIVLGSSLTVYPAAGFPTVAKRRGAKLVIVNREETEQDGIADLVIHEGIGETMDAAVPAS
ncbi:MAG: NAD-dependent deacetylase [Gammaproteobacteria bacterium]